MHVAVLHRTKSRLKRDAEDAINSASAPRRWKHNCSLPLWEYRSTCAEPSWALSWALYTMCRAKKKVKTPCVPACSGGPGLMTGRCRLFKKRLDNEFLILLSVLTTGISIISLLKTPSIFNSLHNACWQFQGELAMSSLSSLLCYQLYQF